MKKLLGIIALGLLFSGNAYAGVNEPGITSIAGCDRGLKSANKKFIILFQFLIILIYLNQPCYKISIPAIQQTQNYNR